MKKLNEISTLGMSREQWLEHRRYTIGGSDAAALLGLNPWQSPLSVYMEKKGLVPDHPDNLAMRLGRELEDVVAKLFEEETGKKVRRKNAILYDPDMPWAHANVDRLVVGENAVLECKTTSELNLKRFKGGEFPAQYYAQVVHYMMVGGYDRAYIAVLIGNKDFKVFTVERDMDEIRALYAVEKNFCEEYLVPGVMPPAGGTDADNAALNAAYPKADETEDEMDLSDLHDAFHAYSAAKANKALCEQIMQQSEQTIKARLGTAPAGACGKYRVTWREQTRNTIDARELKRQYPDIVIPYKQTLSRPFSVKIIEKE